MIYRLAIRFLMLGIFATSTLLPAAAEEAPQSFLLAHSVDLDDPESLFCMAEADAEVVCADLTVDPPAVFVAAKGDLENHITLWIAYDSVEAYDDFVTELGGEAAYADEIAYLFEMWVGGWDAHYAGQRTTPRTLALGANAAVSTPYASVHPFKWLIQGVVAGCKKIGGLFRSKPRDLPRPLPATPTPPLKPPTLPFDPQKTIMFRVMKNDHGKTIGYWDLLTNTFHPL